MGGTAAVRLDPAPPRLKPQGSLRAPAETVAGRWGRSADLGALRTDSQAAAALKHLYSTASPSDGSRGYGPLPAEGADIGGKQPETRGWGSGRTRGRDPVQRILQVLHTLRHRGVAGVLTHTTAIALLCQEGRVQQARKLFRQLREDRLQATRITYNAMLRGEAHSVSPSALHQRARDAGVARVAELCTQMRESCIAPDLQTHTSVLSALQRARRTSSCLGLLSSLRRRGVQLHAPAYNCALGSCAAVSQAEGLLACMRHDSVTPTEITAAAVLGLCRRCGAPDDAERLTAELGVPLGPGEWAELIACYRDAGRLEDAVAAWRRAQRVTTPSETTYAAFLRTLAECCAAARNGRLPGGASRWVRLAERSFEDARQRGAARSPRLWTSMMTVYGAASDAAGATALLQQLRDAGLRVSEPQLREYRRAYAADGPQDEPGADPAPTAAPGGQEGPLPEWAPARGD
eukprot:TRINITY_DN32971_c0_g1_i2.p1 TRINITY_DN32971_c0_g1~~TRINITY_DN32971_c0_g1_i2.p1  ORF type:complete len:462 (+),score=59.18 TRINITY_DN32971_c0_g1_i2:68-1453(+)